MGAEVGATTSTFGYDESMERYLRATGRNEVADAANAVKEHLTADPEVYAAPEKYFDQVIEINLDELMPHINGPFTPDLATPIDQMSEKAKAGEWPLKSRMGTDWLLYQFLLRRFITCGEYRPTGCRQKISDQSGLWDQPGSEQVRYTAERDGLLDIFENLNAKIFTNACGPCIGQWDRAGADKAEKNTIIHSFNRNFSKRADGNPNTHAFVASPEMVAAVAISGRLDFNPMTDTLLNEEGEEIKLDPLTE